MLLLVVLCLAVFPISTFATDAVQVQIPVSIQTSGETPSPEENYTVELQAVDDAPMPSENVLEISGSGKAFFSPIQYTTRHLLLHHYTAVWHTQTWALRPDSLLCKSFRNKWGKW